MFGMLMKKEDVHVAPKKLLEVPEGHVTTQDPLYSSRGVWH
jgi:hypothetical protein